MGVNSLPKTVTRQRRDCDMNPGPTAPESSMLTTWLLSHPLLFMYSCFILSVIAQHAGSGYMHTYTLEHSNSGKKSFDSIRSVSRYRIDFFDSIRFANLINLPLLH